ncbi:hypothetical protein BU16DRAFT_536245 [Lophium mytilinum]|uniref:Uncharacterized protein n=1 Tax=Lophium mytilinum TaxID=390894 RepID=A0A6A6R0G0_9PEZI|nr:hypothetical protein BU16DRAFT_536245 [Lophium mytilinum]
MSLETLEPGGLYVVLFIQNVPPPKNDFHWGLYLHKDKDKGGTKYHIWDPNRDWVWVADHGTTTGLFKSHALVGLFQVARVCPELECEVDSAARSFDDTLNQRPGIGCDVWLFWVLELLREPRGADRYQILKCTDLKALEEEVLAWGNMHIEDAAELCRTKPDIGTVPPRPIALSKLCGL